MTTATVFENPTGNWSYNGPFNAHITTGMDLKKFEQRKSGVRVEGTIIKFGEFGISSRIEHGDQCIKLYTGDQPSYFGFSYLIRLCRPNGQLIWQSLSFLKDVVMQEVKECPRGSWPKFYFDGKQIIGETSRSGTKYQLQEGQEIRFKRHGTFRFVKAFKTLAYLDVTLPRKGWNPRKSTYRIRIPTGKCLTVCRSNYYLEWMNTQQIWNPYHTFGYRPGHQPLASYEVDWFLELLQPGILMEERAREAFSVLSPFDARKQYRELRDVSKSPQLLREKAEKIMAVLKVPN